MMFDQPIELAKVIIGFCNGTITGKFEKKPRNEQLIPANYKKHDLKSNKNWGRKLCQLVIVIGLAILVTQIYNQMV